MRQGAVRRSPMLFPERSGSLAVPATLIQSGYGPYREGRDRFRSIRRRPGGGGESWVAKLRADLASGLEGMLGNKHLVNFLYRWRDFEEWMALALESLLLRRSRNSLGSYWSDFCLRECRMRSAIM